ncbi:accessory gene regulator B family protein [Clostridium subterminale]|uniref:Accessory gene regulator B family protein n=1 Tax=Clostridium subterminale TaxID=1550 RepID=A0ABP3W108_CLOSU
MKLLKDKPILKKDKVRLKMINKLAVKISKILVKNDVVKFDDYEICIYGLEVIFITSLDIIGTLLIGLLLNWLSDTIIFIIFFCLLRINAGGYHAKTPVRCFVLFNILTQGVILLSNNIMIINNITIIILLMAITFILILKYAPSDTQNKPLSSMEKKKHRRNSIITFFIQSLIILGIYFIDNNLINYCTVAAFGSFIEACTLIF